MHESSSVTCLVCRGGELKEFLNLGMTALANRFVPASALSDREPAYPLRVAFCEGCGHVQLLDRVPPEEMFTDYVYISSASETLKKHFDELSGFVIDRQKLSDGFVVDVGCNDGTLLAAFRRRAPKARVLGVDPADNLAQFTEALGIPRYSGLFTAETAADIRESWGQANAITVTNTFPHIQDLHDFAEGVKTLLAPGGALVIEAHYLRDILQELAFDTVYHEHVSYWALGPMVRLFAEHGLEVVDADRLPIHHGQLRVVVRHAGEASASPSVANVIEEERKAGMTEFATYERFGRNVTTLKTELTGTLGALKESGKKVVGYGAPAKGNTLLNYLALGPSQLEYIVDRSPLKQGLYTPGVHIPVVSPDRLNTDQPDYVLLLAWNFQDEILQQQAAYRNAGGRFILPVPEVRII